MPSLRPTLELLKHEPRARLFFLAHAQSSFGSGAAYVALLLLAYERFPSPWTISLVLFADFMPTMLFGPLFGAAADRWSRKWCTVAADAARALAFLGLSQADGLVVLFALALLAGCGNGLFSPAALAGLPSLVEERRLPAATALYGAISDLGFLVGPALAAAGLVFMSPEAVMLANGATFVLSAVLLSRLDFGSRHHADGLLAGGRPSLSRDALDGLRTARTLVGGRTVILASSAVVLFAGMFNVGELLLATHDLGAGRAGFSVLVASFGLGIVLGSLSGSQAATLAQKKRRYLAGVLLVGVGFLGSGLAPTFAVALVTFAAGGLGNGLVLVHERLLLQATVSDSLLGRIFGVKEALTAWAFAVAFLLAPSIQSLVGTRALVALAGAGGLIVFAWSAVALRRVWREPAPELAASAP